MSATGIASDWWCSRSKSLDSAKRWYASPTYQDAKRLREGAANLNMVAVQGIV